MNIDDLVEFIENRCKENLPNARLEEKKLFILGYAIGFLEAINRYICKSSV
jgi:hypothetical protein